MTPSLCSIGSHRWSTECEDRGRPTSSPDLSPALASVAHHSHTSSCLSPRHFGLAGVNYCFMTVPFAITYIFSALLKYCFKAEFPGSRVSFCFCAIQGMRKEFRMSLYDELRGAFNIVCCLCLMKRLENNQSKRILKYSKISSYFWMVSI